MSQVATNTPRGSLRITASNQAVSVAMAATTQLLEIITEAVEKVSFQIDNTVQALDAFTVSGRVHPDASYFTIASVAGDFSAPLGRVSNVSGAPVSLAASASARFDLDTSGLYSVKIVASAAADSAVVSIFASGSAAGQATPNVTLVASDIEIGAVEIKNASDDTRATVGANGLYVDVRTSASHPVTVVSGGIAAGAVATGALVDGADLTQGATGDTAVITDLGGSVSAKLRGLIALWVTHIGTALAPSGAVVTSQRPGVTQVVSTALEASHVLKANAGQLVQLSVFSSKATAQYILVMNSTTLPGDGAVTLLFPPIPILGNSLLVLDLPAPLVASTGIVVCNSSTGSFTKTIGSADCVFYSQVN